MSYLRHFNRKEKFDAINISSLRDYFVPTFILFHKFEFGDWMLLGATPKVDVFILKQLSLKLRNF